MYILKYFLKRGNCIKLEKILGSLVNPSLICAVRGGSQQYLAYKPESQNFLASGLSTYRPSLNLIEYQWLKLQIILKTYPKPRVLLNLSWFLLFSLCMYVIQSKTDRTKLFLSKVQLLHFYYSVCIIVACPCVHVFVISNFVV